MKYDESNSFGDNDLNKEYQGREIALNLLRIANELAEKNRLKTCDIRMNRLLIACMAFLLVVVMLFVFDILIVVTDCHTAGGDMSCNNFIGVPTGNLDRFERILESEKND